MTKQKEVIALLIHSLSPGGMERVMTELANYLTRFDHIKVHLVLFGKSPIIFYGLKDSIIVHKPKTGFNDKIRFVETFKRMIFLRLKIKQINPDSILSFGIHWNNFILLSLMGLHYPIFVSDRGSPTRRYTSFHRFMRKKLYKGAAGIIAQTTIAREFIQKILPDSNITVIGNPIRLIVSENQGIPKENIILSVGRLINTKHHDKLIHIYSKLTSPGWKLVIVGGNAIKQNNFEKLQQLIVELDLIGKVILAGEQKDVDKYYLQSKIFAFTSSVEGFPNVVGEALSAGCPVVSYDCMAGPSELIIDRENGFLVPVFDDDLFQKRMQFLIDNPKLLEQMSENAKKSVSKFSIEKIGEKYYSFITSLSCSTKNELN